MWRHRNPSADNTKSKAYLVYSEWGPDRAIPRDVRLADQFPATDEALRAEWMADFDRIEREIWLFAESGGPRLHSYDTFRRQMAKLFLFMNDEALGRAWALAGYYTAHEGY